MKITRYCPVLQTLQYLCESHSPGRWSWASDWVAEQREIDLPVLDAVQLAKRLKFPGVVLRVHSVHCVDIGGGNYRGKPVISLDSVNLSDDVDRAIAGFKPFPSGWNPHVVSQKVGA